MPGSRAQHRRTHNLLLISRLLNQNDSVSPLTLILDDLEQSGKHVVRQVLRRARIAKTRTVFVSHETLRKPADVDVFVEAWSQSFSAVQKTVNSHISDSSEQRTLIVFDGLNSLCTDPDVASNIPALLASFFRPNVSLLGVYHTDSPVSGLDSSPYVPDPLTLLKYVATAIFTTHSLGQVLARKAARYRSVAEPVYGLAQGIGGILVGQGANGDEGTVFEMEYRRKSGRAVRDWYFLPRRPISGDKSRDIVMLLDDHPLVNKPRDDQKVRPELEDEGELNVTFELGLSERQKRDRDGIVLPYLDAQKDAGGQGGRILYDMGAEDDFDEEEDEI